MKNKFYLPNLDGLRFIAFLLVFIYHFTLNNSYLGVFLKLYGWIGVELFFILSSFLLSSLLINEHWDKGKISIFKYFIRRILRIWPLYFTYIGFVVLFGILFIHSFHLKDNLIRLLGLLTFTDNIFSAFQGYNNFPWSTHLWTISFEEQFYLILPFIIPLIVKIKRNTLINSLLFIWIIIVLLRILAVYMNIPHPFIWTLIIQGDALILGVFLGTGLINIKTKISSAYFLLLGISILGILAFIQNVDIMEYNQVYIYSIVALGLGIIVYGILINENKCINLLLGNTAIRYLGKISYGLYVFHLFSIDITNRLTIKLQIHNWWLSFLLGLIITIFISSLSYEILEKRFLKLKEKFTIIISRPV